MHASDAEAIVKSKIPFHLQGQLVRVAVAVLGRVLFPQKPSGGIRDFVAGWIGTLTEEGASNGPPDPHKDGGANVSSPDGRRSGRGTGTTSGPARHSKGAEAATSASDRQARWLDPSPSQTPVREDIIPSIAREGNLLQDGLCRRKLGSVRHRRPASRVHKSRRTGPCPSCSQRPLWRL